MATKKIKPATKKEIQEIKEIFLKHYPDSLTELDYKNIYELLIAVMLSAQCTDKRVNIITPALFKAYPTVVELANADLDEVKSYISSCSFFNNKAKNLIKMAQSVIENYDGKIPEDRDELVTLAGVGQ
ncbi:MAG TPA: endonuclease III, partial [Campylobacterales bacterium]|nr:endonuclease III [Campylobacterales bacterium]